MTVVHDNKTKSLIIFTQSLSVSGWASHNGLAAEEGHVGDIIICVAVRGPDRLCSIQICQSLSSATMMYS